MKEPWINEKFVLGFDTYPSFILHSFYVLYFITVSPVPPKRTTSRITKSEHEITPTQFMEKSTVVLSQPVESPPETNLNDTEPQGTIRERIRAEILPELLQPRIEEIIIENESKISPLKITLAVIFLSIGIGVFYLLFF